MAINLSGVRNQAEDDRIEDDLPPERAAESGETRPVAGPATGDEFASLVSEIEPSAPPSIKSDSGTPSPTGTAARGPSAASVPPIGSRTGVHDAESAANGNSSETSPGRSADPDPASTARKPEEEPEIHPALAEVQELLAGMDPEQRAEIEEKMKREHEKMLAARRGVDPAVVDHAYREGQMGPTGPGNAFDSIINLAAAPIVGVARGLARGTSEFRRILAERGEANEAARRMAAGEGMRERIFGYKQKNLQRNVDDVVSSSEGLAADVGAFNSAFLGSSAARKLEAEARKSGMPMETFLGELSAGRGDPAHLKLAREAMNEPTVADAWSRVESRMEKVRKHAGMAKREFELLQKNFPDRFDAAGAAESIEGAMDTANGNVKDPAFEDPESGPRLREQMQELAERIVKWVKEFIENILQAVGVRRAG